MPNDLVHVSDAGRISLSKKAAYFWGDEKSVVEVKGWVTCLLRERGKIVPGSRRSGHNVWTDTGREFLALLMSYKSTTSTTYRNDRIAYIGVGTGAQTEDSDVVGLISPIAYNGSGDFLAPIDHSLTTFPTLPIRRTSVRYTRAYAEDELSTISTPTVLINEFGLFTDGHQNTFAVDGRDKSLANATAQSPVAYKAMLEPVQKTSGIELEIDWEIRF
jgi:hypothetical protein